MINENVEVRIEEEFHVSKYIIFFKFVFGLVEVLLAIGLILFGRQASRAYHQFKITELLEDPRDLLVNITEKFVPYLFKHMGLVIMVLLVLGAVKIVGSLGLVCKKHW